MWSLPSVERCKWAHPYACVGTIAWVESRRKKRGADGELGLQWWSHGIYRVLLVYYGCLAIQLLRS